MQKQDVLGGMLTLQSRQEVIKTGESHPENKITEGLSKMIADVMKPEKIDKGIDKGLLQKKRKKKRQSHHL